MLDTIHKGVLPIAEVKLENSELLEMNGLAQKAGYSRTTLLGLTAAREALRSARAEGLSGTDTALVSATTVGGMDRSEGFYTEFLADPSKGKLRDIVHHDCADSTSLIAAHLKLGGIVTTVSTACSSSVNAIMFAVNLIRNGRTKRVLAGGTDSVTRFTLNGFNTLMILDKTGCHPFDAQRAGLTLGEGAAWLMLESEDSARERGVPVIAEVAGFGNANDAYHQTASSPDGEGPFRAMLQALKRAGLQPEDIDYVNVHGTGTENNDLTEGLAMKRLFGSRTPLFSSTKGFTGHTLGAAGAVESVISLLSLGSGMIFPNLGFKSPIPELGMTPVVSVIKEIKLKNVMSNSFGFGGNCSSVVYSRFEAV
jgi:3-oxoacyl-[acyl-carrier-protein] synthase-1